MLKYKQLSEVILLTLFSLSLIVLVSCGGVAPSNSGPYYIAPGGSDDNAGTIDAPFATLTHAQNVARRYGATGPTIYLRAGTYFLADTLQLGQRDSGMTWAAYKSEQVSLSGGTVLVGWTGPDSLGRWLAHSDLDNFRQLYVNGVRATRSRLPLTNPVMSVSSDTITGSGGFVIPTDVSAWKNPSDMELGLFASFNRWSQSICGVERVASTAGGTLVTLNEPCFYLARHKGGMQVTTSTYLENAMELLGPGQFYFDRPNYSVYYIPRPGENMRTAEVIAPRLQTLMTATGTIDEPVNNISFTGIAFEHAGWLGTSSTTGFPEIQSTFRINPDALITLSDGTLFNPSGEFVKTPGGVILTYTRNATFERCSFAHLGGSGIDIQLGSTGNVISGAKVFDISANGIQIGDVLANDFAPVDQRMTVRGNTVSNSYIHGTGAEYTGAVGVFAGYTAQTVLVHNEITDLPYTGISMGWGWGLEDPTPAGENLVQFNFIHNVMQQRADGGGVYLNGRQPRTVIDSNQIDGNSGPPGGIYLDSGSDGIAITNNVVFSVGGSQPGYPASLPLIYFNGGTCQALGCTEYGNTLGDPSATLSGVGLQPPYLDLLN